MKYIYGYGFGRRRLHWACEICIVRAMCKEDECFMTNLLHSLCLTCKKNHKCKEECKILNFTILCEEIEHGRYGRMLKHYSNEYYKTGLAYQLARIKPFQKNQRWVI